MANTKIIATLGPASKDQGLIRDLILAGVDVFRVNMSHGSYELVKEILENVRKVCAHTKTNIPVFMDLRGPKIRIGLIENDEATLEKGKMCTINADPKTPGNASVFGTDYKYILTDVDKGDTVLLDDGKIVLEVDSVDEKGVKCVIKTGGLLKSRKGLMLPGKEIKLPALSDKDIADVKYGMELGFDGFMLSFVQKSQDVIELHGVMRSCGGERPVISKIESAKGIENLETIAEVSDALLVARGDLGVELPVWELPFAQSQIIKAAREKRKPVIVATEMLESMITNSRPTRAEVSDVAGAVTGGADLVMLSGETAVGKYPVLAVEFMDRTLEHAEKMLAKPERVIDLNSDHIMSESVACSAVQLSKNIKAAAILIYTKKGFSARMISYFAPLCPIYVFSEDPATARMCSIYRSTLPFVLSNKPENFEQFMTDSVEFLIDKNLLKKGDPVVAVNVAGHSCSITHQNSIKVFAC